MYCAECGKVLLLLDEGGTYERYQACCNNLGYWSKLKPTPGYGTSIQSYKGFYMYTAGEDVCRHKLLGSKQVFKLPQF